MNIAKSEKLIWEESALRLSYYILLYCSFSTCLIQQNQKWIYITVSLFPEDKPKPKALCRYRDFNTVLCFHNSESDYRHHILQQQ